MATDNFNRADNAALGASWSEDEPVTTNIQVLANQVRFDVSNVQNAFARRVAAAPNDQDSQLVYVGGAGAQQVGVMIRSGGPSTNFTGYVATCWSQSPGNGMTLRKYVNAPDLSDASGTSLGAALGDIGAGQIFKISVVGTTIKVFMNGIEKISVVDAAIASGKTGIFVHSSAASTSDWDSWEGTEDAGGGGSHSSVYLVKGLRLGL